MKTASSSAGQIVVDSKGMSLYFFTKDVKDSGTSACTGACLQAWPVFTTTSDAPGVDGVTGAVGTIATPDGKKQVTLNGMPLYYYAKDKAAGDVTGQGVGGVWYLVSPSGEMIKGAAASGY
jgi:predicted lipoprotein with Yx(FWY)xxD motif